MDLKPNNYPRILQSSANPQNLALTAKGIIWGMIPLMIFLASTQGVVLTEIGIVDFINRGLFIISEILILIGLLRKAYYWLQARER